MDAGAVVEWLEVVERWWPILLAFAAMFALFLWMSRSALTLDGLIDLVRAGRGMEPLKRPEKAVTRFAHPRQYSFHQDRERALCEALTAQITQAYNTDSAFRLSNPGVKDVPSHCCIGIGKLDTLYPRLKNSRFQGLDLVAWNEECTRLVSRAHPSVLLALASKGEVRH